jgi:outer membrane biosynthesis protein TonB
VAIDERGHVSDVKVISGLGHGLDEAAVSAIRSAQCQFTPALANDGRAVPYVIKRYTFQFQLP